MYLFFKFLIVKYVPAFINKLFGIFFPFKQFIIYIMYRRMLRRCKNFFFIAFIKAFNKIMKKVNNFQMLWTMHDNYKISLARRTPYKKSEEEQRNKQISTVWKKILMQFRENNLKKNWNIAYLLLFPLWIILLFTNRHTYCVYFGRKKKKYSITVFCLSTIFMIFLWRNKIWREKRGWKQTSISFVCNPLLLQTYNSCIYSLDSVVFTFSLSGSSFSHQCQFYRPGSIITLKPPGQINLT